MEDQKQHLRGFGDVVEWVTEISGIKYLVKRVYGNNCNCSKRKDSLNKLLPFNPMRDYSQSYNPIKKDE
tara:strand:- start:380 stop:586 length:207 start_codon:yes stop_codon:yes gene_type:complete